MSLLHDWVEFFDDDQRVDQFIVKSCSAQDTGMIKAVYENDVRELILCKDCVAKNEGRLLHQMWCGKTGAEISEYDFCSKGEKE